MNGSHPVPITSCDAEPAPRILVIFNPVAGWRRRRRLDRALARLGKLGFIVDLEATSGCGDAERIARRAAGTGWHAIAVAGGDGTLNEVVNGLAPGAPPLLVLALGTANVLAGEIGLDRVGDTGAQAALACEGAVARIRPGLANGRMFLMMAGVGFDAHVVRHVDPRTKRRLGKLAYVLQAIREAFRFTYPRYRITVDGVAHEAASVIVAKGRRYGGRHIVAPAADLAGDRFEVCLFEDTGPLAVLRYGLALLLGRLPRARGYRIVSGREVAIDGPPGDPVQADGDIIATLPVRITVAARTIDMLVPPATTSGTFAGSRQAPSSFETRPGGRP